MKSNLSRGLQSLVIVLGLLIQQGVSVPTPFDLAFVKNGVELGESECSANTLIDISFSSSSILSCTASACSVTNPSQNTISYLDVVNNYVTYTLTNAQLIQETIVTGFSYGFTFKYADPTGSMFLYLSIPLTDSYPSSSKYKYETIDLSKVSDSSLSTLKSLSDANIGSGIALSGFNFLSGIDYKQFYEVMDSTHKQSWLVSKIFYQISYTPTNKATTTLLPAFTPDYSTSGVFCWTSLVNGPFQTHMRESFALWFFILMVLIMWIFIMCSNENTDEVYAPSFQDNKWTCWSLYSLYHLANEEFFTRLSRSAVMMITAAWQAMVTCAIYSTLYKTANNGIVIWAAVVGWAASIPFPYVLGNCFLKRMYQHELQKYGMKLRLLKIDAEKKKEKQDLEQEIIQKTEFIDSIYYFYYAMILALLALFSILSVHALQPLMDEYYYRQLQWLATMGIIICWEHFILDPILTALVGDKGWYRNRGYFYDGQLGVLHKQIE